VFDSVLIAYRLAEDARVRLPAIVNLDGFTLSFTREPVALPQPAQAAQFLREFDDAQGVGFRAGRPVSQAVSVLGGSNYSYFRYQTHLAALQALEVHEEVAREFAQRFGRSYGLVERYRCEDAEIAFFMIGAFATKAKEAVDRLRESGVRAGLVRPRLLRPYPGEAVRRALQSMQAVAVIDQDLSFGAGGVLYAELCAALHGMDNAPLLASYVGGLGGRDIAAEEFYQIARELREAARERRAPPPRLLYTEEELRRMRNLQAVAVAQSAAPGAVA
jgi:pyruvate ferredoxin oxidoreductase alpha subunit